MLRDSRLRPSAYVPVLIALVCALCSVSAASASAAPVSATALRTEAMTEAFGIDKAQPRLSWQLSSSRRGELQESFEVRVGTSPSSLASAPVWDSGLVHSGEPWVEYSGPALQSRTRYFWQVKVWDNHGSASSWSTPTWFETALMSQSEWGADWIQHPITEAEEEECETKRDEREEPREGDCPPGPLFRTEFEVGRHLKSARLYASGLGYGVYHLNGQRVGDLQLAPAFTDYNDTVFYNSFDVTNMVKRGRNAIGAALGRGFFGPTEDGVILGDFAHASWHGEPRLRLQLYLTYADGHTQVVSSGPSWKTTYGPTVYDNIYRGETYDAARAAELGAWAQPGYDDSGWEAAAVATAPKGAMTAQDMEPERVIERPHFKSMTEPEPGVFVFDLGHTVSGWASVDVAGAPGDTLHLRYGFGLEENGTVPPGPDPLPPFLAHAEHEDVYRLAGTGQTETYRPQFGFHVFRYLEIRGWPAGSKPTLASVRGEVVHTDVARVGHLATSSKALNDILDAANRTFQDTLHEVPEGNPFQEKAGWTGDSMLMEPAITWLYGTQDFWSKWDRDVRESQAADGSVSPIAPGEGTLFLEGPDPGFDGALFAVPMDIYLRYGDVRPLQASYAPMQHYLEYAETNPLWAAGETDFFPDPPGTCEVGICSGIGGIGDNEPAEGVPGGRWPDANAWLYMMERDLAEAAQLLGHSEEAAVYEAKAASTKAEFNRVFFDEAAGYYIDPEAESIYSQHVNAMALQLGLVPTERRESVVASIAADVEARGDHLSTGADGVRFLWSALSENGHLEEALTALSQETYPSYGYLRHGLGYDVLTGGWDGRGVPEAFKGSVVQWFFENLAGIRPAAPGFAKIEFRPEIPEHGLEWVNASFESVRGEIASRWRKSSRGLKLEVTVPPGATGVVYLPGSEPQEIGSGTYRFFVGS